MSKAEKIYYVFPPVVYACIIFFLSSQQNLKPPIEFKISDKLFHLAEYGILAILVLRAIKNKHSRIIPLRPYFFGMAGSMIYGLSDEIHQHFVPGRFCSAWDFFADVIGIIIFGTLFLIFSNKKRDMTL